MGFKPLRLSCFLPKGFIVDEREFLPSPPADRPGPKRLRSMALATLGALLLLFEAALVLRWLDPTVLAHVQRALHNRPGHYGALLAIVVINVLLACGAQLELSAPRTHFEHVVNVLALPIFAAFCDTLLLGAFVDPGLPNARIGALVAIALCFANLSLEPYIVGLWWAMRRPYRLRPSAAEGEEPHAPDAVRPRRWVWETPSAPGRPFAPIGQVALLGLTLALAVVQVAVICAVQAPHVSESWFIYGLVVSFISAAIVQMLFFLAYRRAAPMLPRLHRH